MVSPKIKLSLSEKQTMRYISEGDRRANEMDWIALQRLEKLGSIEERGSGFAITKERRGAMRPEPSTS
jgi:hypothetical protein